VRVLDPPGSGGLEVEWVVGEGGVGLAPKECGGVIVAVKVEVLLLERCHRKGSYPLEGNYQL